MEKSSLQTATARKLIQKKSQNLINLDALAKRLYFKNNSNNNNIFKIIYPYILFSQYFNYFLGS
jgi:hypothetical protein